MAKGLKLKIRKFYKLGPAFVEVTGEKLVGGAFCPPSPILNRVKLLPQQISMKYNQMTWLTTLK